ncbi:MAG TPA: DUF305 domain-containing protein [Herbaspirillum sp.]|jgi:uncharacterized protein (DUF305 family)
MKNAIHTGACIASRLWLGLVLSIAGAGAQAQGMQPMSAMQGMQHHQKPPIFIATTAKPFPALMNDAMAVMDDGMQRAPMNGKAEHDFITMMMPHHQGAIDMAKGMLLYTKDPEIRNLALGIITDQENEIRVMQAWLAHHPEASRK